MSIPFNNSLPAESKTASSLSGLKNQYRVDYILLYCKYQVISKRFLILWLFISSILILYCN